MKIALFTTVMAAISLLLACDVSSEEEYQFSDVMIEQTEEGFLLVGDDGVEMISDQVTVDVDDQAISRRTATADEVGGSCYCQWCSCDTGGCLCGGCQGPRCPAQQQL